MTERAAKMRPTAWRATSWEVGWALQSSSCSVVRSLRFVRLSYYISILNGKMKIDDHIFTTNVTDEIKNKHPKTISISTWSC